MEFQPIGELQETWNKIKTVIWGIQGEHIETEEHGKRKPNHG